MYDAVGTDGDTRRSQTESTLKKIAMIGNFPPRQCGIATFTADLREAIQLAAPDARCDVVAMSDQANAYAYPDAVAVDIPQPEPQAYIDAARQLNASGVQLVNVQHEFGIFGGDAGGHLLLLLTNLNCPVVTTLHTVLEHPNDAQFEVMKELITLSTRVVVMSEKGREILRRVYGASARKIDVVPHGAPDRPLKESGDAKARLGFTGRDVMVTFGLLSPNKGIECAIRALPEIASTRPEALYVIVGATHPHLVKHEGERYRESLRALAEELGVSRNVHFVNAYLDTDALLEYLEAADIYLTPYLNKAQITSGTLSYAIALGRPVISTPYWHAEELLSDDSGILTPFGDSEAISDAAIRLLTHSSYRQAMSQRAYLRGRETIWSRVGGRYVDVFEAALSERSKQRVARKISSTDLSPCLDALERMSDACGIFQHARLHIPDRHHGYCVDDNARALILTQRLGQSGVRSPTLSRAAVNYASFVEHAWNEERGRFRNFMSYDRRWLEPAGSCDSNGRTFWSLGETAMLARDRELRRWAVHLANRTLPSLLDLQPLRANAFMALGLCGLVHAGVSDAKPPLQSIMASIADAFDAERRPGWDWFEPHLAYDNARLPEALLRAGVILNDDAILQRGVSALRFLMGMQTGEGGCFRAVGNQGFERSYQRPALFDQQPLEACATVDAAWAAFDATGDLCWRREAERAFCWFLGENDLGVSLMPPEGGGCYDGLSARGVNLNQGAESILSYQLATAAMRSRMRAAATGV